MLHIQNLQTKIGDKIILDHLQLQIPLGETHLIMGPNGSGKSSLLQVIMGNPPYETTAELFTWQQQNLLSTPNFNRRGIFLIYQQGRSIPGLISEHFLYQIYKNRILQQSGLSEFEAKKDPEIRFQSGPVRFKQLLRQYCEKLQIDLKLLQRGLNEGFSGGEKKKMEILQMLLLEPQLVLIDEIEAGLDTDAFQICHQVLAEYQAAKSATFLVVSHQVRALDYFHPQLVYLMKGGQIIKQGDKNLAQQIHQFGYQTPSC
ncbi:MAG TPA: Fe-S cluster assembly ATPase SufC [Candidatus Gracilibacteria bacterium]|nr:Fe-S cluster assembly ATPase SufC [Candidatus Gracilibacteria bacterium]